MGEPAFDIVIVADPRFQGGTSSAVAAEATAAARAGYTVGLVCYEAINLRQPFPFHPALKRLVQRGDLRIVPPGERVRCCLAVLHSPFVAGLLPIDPVGITAERRLVVVHHPPLDAHGAPDYDVAEARRNAEEILAGPADWAPVGPNARAAFAQIEGAPPLLAEDWHNTLDFNAWYGKPEPRPARPLTIGRHSRADLRKFPGSRDAFLAIYGDEPEMRVDLLGCPSQIRMMLDPVPPNWTLRPFGALAVEDYLDGLDVFVYYHREDWVEAFGYAVLEAMARGVPCVLPETLGPSFGAAARIVPPESALDAAKDVASAPEATREAGYALVREHHSFDAVLRRLDGLIGKPHGAGVPGLRAVDGRVEDTAPEVGAEPGGGLRPAVLLVSTNGVGMGHLTRTIAIARRLQAPIKPVVVTMSHAAHIAETFGLHAEFIPYHRYLNVPQKEWHTFLTEELTGLVDAFGARVILFDGNSPFQGLLDTFVARPAVWSIWCRRGMWRENAGAQFIARESAFDAVIEPQDLAGAFDRGLTVKNTDRTRPVAPIRLLDRAELLPRSLARRELGLDPDRLAILLQLGSGNNFDMSLVNGVVRHRLGMRPDVAVVEVTWIISDGAEQAEKPDNFRQIRSYPVARYLNAFDATVSAVGYNSFHEICAAGLPAIYVPNENPSQDDQLVRASYAERRGAALVARRDRPEALVAGLEAVLDPVRRALMAEAAARLAQDNGALAAAQIVSHFALTHRGDRASLLG